ncbi:SPW repeat domain-containing protein [Amycolatopsis sp. CA-230715]|uniref:SPW repeat domain-containing protein n=1 Tax=Amycolatopsis sp. CA-230715 TaxID=2745196 RepID=UPI001C022850|nr:SPW repeat protein [Amycolatopsis sp. CA-230715]QWF86057.1 hypothetical protein HUW46_09538 [Amycolatopsis sp. CA-230715]
MTTTSTEPRTASARPAREAGNDPVVQRAGAGSGLALLAGLYLILSPWVTRSIDQFGLVASNVITGIAMALLAVGFARSPSRLRTLAWVTPVIGAWVIASPWLVYRGSGLMQLEFGRIPELSTATRLSDVIAGAVIVLAGFSLISAARKADGQRHLWSG